MLVLTRRMNEEIVIGENVRLTVVRIEGGKVRLGIAAPAAVRVRREEHSATQPSTVVGVANTPKIRTRTTSRS